MTAIRTVTLSKPRALRRCFRDDTAAAVRKESCQLKASSQREVFEIVSDNVHFSLTKENLHENKYFFPGRSVYSARVRSIDSLFRRRLARRGEFRGVKTQASPADLWAPSHQRHWRRWLRTGPANRSFKSESALH